MFQFLSRLDIKIKVGDRIRENLEQRRLPASKQASKASAEQNDLTSS